MKIRRRNVRQMSWSNLKRSIEQIRTLSFVKAGRESGYHWCCIVTYIVRSVSMEISGILFGTFEWFLTPCMKGVAKPQPGSACHILCPCHKLLYRNSNLIYRQCGSCGWVQFDQAVDKKYIAAQYLTNHCRRCGA